MDKEKLEQKARDSLGSLSVSLSDIQKEFEEMAFLIERIRTYLYLASEVD